MNELNSVNDILLRRNRSHAPSLNLRSSELNPVHGHLNTME